MPDDMPILFLDKTSLKCVNVKFDICIPEVM